MDGRTHTHDIFEGTYTISPGGQSLLKFSENQPHKAEFGVSGIKNKKTTKV